MYGSLSRRRVKSDDDSEEDYVSVELPSFGDIGDDNAIATALQKCKKQVLQPYSILLKLVSREFCVCLVWSGCMV